MNGSKYDSALCPNSQQLYMQHQHPPAPRFLLMMPVAVAVASGAVAVARGAGAVASGAGAVASGAGAVTAGVTAGAIATINDSVVSMRLMLLLS
jgi:hypothetical protein